MLGYGSDTVTANPANLGRASGLALLGMQIASCDFISKRGSRDGETSEQFASATEKWRVAGTGFGAGRASGHPRQKAIPHTRLASDESRSSGAGLPGSAEVRG